MGYGSTAMQAKRMLKLPCDEQAYHPGKKERR